jgi:ATP-binding cassette subfamily B protein
LKVEDLRASLSYPYEQPLFEGLKKLLVEAEVPEQRQKRVMQAILNEQLSPLILQCGWILRDSPGNNPWTQFRHAGALRPAILLGTMYVIQILLSIASWVVLGRGIFLGHFQLGWLLAWAILLLATIPVQMVVGDAQSELSIRLGAVFKQRLLDGMLKLNPDEIRHQGMGQFLGRVMESEAVEMLGLSGGLLAILSFVELILAVAILSQGAGGTAHALLLVFWIAIILGFLYRYYQMSRDWISTYREMTNDLVERMVGHRTRLVQEDPRFWHEEEDQVLDRYLKLSENLDRVGIQLNALASRGWILIGLAGVAIPFVTNTSTPQGVAISLGGILLAAQGLGKLAGGAQSLVSLFLAWDQVGPLFNAAGRERELQPLDFFSIQPQNEAGTNLPDQERIFLTARDINYQYHPSGRAVLRDCELQLLTGDRYLLEGPSGGGKSTLAAILTGLRIPQSGSLLLWGMDRKLLGVEEWRRHVVMAPQFQENHIFSESLAFNLLMGRRWPAQPEDLQEAEAICRELGLGEVIDRMPSGFQQMLGESGWQLSHGERSRLYIARTLLQNAEFVILDESFAALDPENLSRALTCVLKRAPTLLVIAHP